MPRKRSSDKLPSHRNTYGRISRRSRNGAGHRGSNGSASEDLVRSLLEGLHEGVANITAEGVVLYANSKFAELLCARPTDVMLGSNLKRFVSAAYWVDLEAALARGIRMPAEGEMNVVTSGRPRTIHLSLTPVCLSQEPSIKITAREVTELVEKDKALQDSEASLHSLSARILQLQDQERRRIARDLHDITGQELAVVAMSLNQLARKMDLPGVNARQGIVDVVGLVRKIEDEIRTLSYVLHPPLLDDFGLGSALSWYVEGFTKRSGIDVELKVAEDVPRLSMEKETALFRVVQESLTNVLRHSGSRKARIRVATDADSVELSVEDEGRGFERGKLASIQAAHAEAGVGIAGMRERLQQLGGNLAIHSRMRGTELVASVPIVEGESTASRAEAAVSQAIAETPTPGAAVAETCKKRVLIADDHEVTRHGIKMLLKDEPDIDVCGEARDGLEAVIKARELDPDLVIMDVGMPRVGGFSAAHTIRESGLHAKILFFSTHTYSQLERMSRVAGFEGFVQKTNGAQDLVRGVRAVLAGNRFYDSDVIQEPVASSATAASCG